jgi:hypothetical protein
MSRPVAPHLRVRGAAPGSSGASFSPTYSRQMRALVAGRVPGQAAFEPRLTAFIPPCPGVVRTLTEGCLALDKRWVACPADQVVRLTGPVNTVSRPSEVRAIEGRISGSRRDLGSALFCW